MTSRRTSAPGAAQLTSGVLCGMLLGAALYMGLVRGQVALAVALACVAAGSILTAVAVRQAAKRRPADDAAG